MDKLMKILNKIKPGVDFTTADDLIEKKVLSSIDIVSLVMEICCDYEIEISPVELVPENFKNAKTIMQLIEKCED